jgi:ABC-2 type transport system permease protein
MRLALLHARTGTLELLRLPAFSVPTVGFPALFFLFFAVPGFAADQPELATALFAGFAVLGVAFFQFGVGIAAERASPWERYLRTLPLAPATRFAALLTVSPELSAVAWLELAVALLAGSVPFALLGIALGYLASPRAALPIANVVYLALAYAGGLWTGPENLPHAVERVSPLMPTRAYADALASAALGLHGPLRAWITLGLYTAGAAWLAGWAYRRDEGQRFR